MVFQSTETAIEDVLDFNANNSNSSMQGHAEGNDIHPVNIAYLPLIAY